MPPGSEPITTMTPNATSHHGKLGPPAAPAGVRSGLPGPRHPTCYCMSMLDRRLQVLIDEERWSRLEQEAARRRVSVGVLVREALDERFPGDAEQRRSALQAILDAEPMAVPEPGELRQELEAIRTRRPE